MPYSWRIGQLLAKVESPEGTLATLAAADAAGQVEFDDDIDMDVPFFARNVVSALAGSFPGIAGGLRLYRYRFRMPLHGSGAAGTAPSWGLLMTAAGFTEAIVASTSVTYVYKATGWTPSLTMARNVNGMEFKAHGSRCKSLRLVFEAGKAPAVEFEFWGGYNEPSAVAAVAPTYQTGRWDPVLGGTATLDTSVVEFSALEITIENELEPRPKPSLASGVFSVHGAPGVIAGSIDPMVEVPGTYNFANKMTTMTEGALSLVIGATAGSILTVSAPKVQWSALKPDRRGHTLIYRASLAFNRSAGDDSLSLACT